MGPLLRVLTPILLAAFAATAAPEAPIAASDPAPAAKVADEAKKHPGRKVYRRKTCLACHGRNGAKAIQDYPNVAGQNERYMVNQINDIISGKRTGSPDATGNPRAEGMRGALVTPEGEVRLSKEEIKQVANWLAGLPPAAPKPPQEPISADRMKAGKKFYKKAKCQTCHGKDGKKPLKGYPYVAGQKRAYLIIQMTDIRDKHRTNGKSKVMLPFVKKLGDEDIALLADYLSQVDRSKK